MAAGQSCAPSAQVEMLAALLDSLSIAKVALVAKDSGGAVAQLFVLRYPQRVRARALDPNPLAGIEASLRRCTVPTRILWGTADTIFSPASADYLDRTLPNSRGVWRIPGAKLFFPEELPDVIAGELRKLAA